MPLAPLAWFLASTSLAGVAPAPAEKPLVPAVRAALVFRVASGGSSLHAAQLGDGAPVIVVPGGPGMASRYLSDTLPALAGRSLVFYDPRGCGSSLAGLEPPTFDSSVQEIEDVRQSLLSSRVVLLAHSYGALPACAYAARNPGRVSALILVSPAGLYAAAWERDGERLKARLAKMGSLIVPPVDGVGDPMVAHMQSILPGYFLRPKNAKKVSLAGASGVVHRDVMRDLGAFDYREAFFELPVRTLVVWGRHDWIGTWTRKDWKAALPAAKTVELGSSGHFPFVEQDALFRAAVESFLRQAAPAR